MKTEVFYSYRYFINYGLQIPLIEKRNQIIELIKKCKQGHLQKELKGGRVFGLVYIREIATSVHLLKFYKPSTITKYEFDIHDDISAVQDETFPFVFLVIDTENQIVLMSRNTSVFQTEKTVNQRFKVL